MQIPSDQTAVLPYPWPSGLSPDPNRGLPTQPSHGGYKATELTPRPPPVPIREQMPCTGVPVCFLGQGWPWSPHLERKDQAHGGPGRGQAGSLGPQAPQYMPLCVSTEGVHVCACMCMCVCVCVSVCGRCLYGMSVFYVSVCIYACVCVYKGGCTCRVCVSLCPCMGLYVCLFVYVFVCTSVCIYVCLCVCVLVCVYTRGCPCQGCV